MAFTFDVSTDVGKVRLLTSDLDPDATIFQDNEIQGFIDLSPGGSVKRAAALALRTIAANEVYVQKRIRALDLSTDGPAEADALRKLASDLEGQAREEEAADPDEMFATAEMVYDPHTYHERLDKEFQRSG